MGSLTMRVWVERNGAKVASRNQQAPLLDQPLMMQLSHRPSWLCRAGLQDRHVCPQHIAVGIMETQQLGGHPTMDRFGLIHGAIGALGRFGLIHGAMEPKINKPCSSQHRALGASIHHSGHGQGDGRDEFQLCQLRGSAGRRPLGHPREALPD